MMHSGGYSGERCSVENNECASQPCENGGTCIEGFDFYECECIVNQVVVHTRVQHGTVPVQYRDFALYGTVLYFQILSLKIKLTVINCKQLKKFTVKIPVFYLF